MPTELGGMNKEGGMNSEQSSNKDEGDIDGITQAIDQRLVVSGGSTVTSTKGAVSRAKMPVEKTRGGTTLVCRDNCCHSDHSHHGHPTGRAPILIPIPVKQVVLEEHGDTHQIKVDGEDLVTITYTNYESETQMKDIMSLITKDLSEPYSVYTYRYFIHNWPKLSFLAYCGEKCIGAIVCKLDVHKKLTRRGYIAMLAVDNSYRRHQIGSNLVIKAIRMMIEQSCDEVVLETEITNVGALRLYENLGFVRDKRLFKYYLNGVDALRLKLWLH